VTVKPGDPLDRHGDSLAARECTEYPVTGSGFVDLVDEHRQHCC
jgi:hypothetical protein